jgi:uncharacterized membrane protein
MDVSIRDRWLGAICYLSVLVFIPIFTKDKSEFLTRHCRQGFALLFAEVVLLLLLAAIEATIGRIPIIGLLISILLHLAYFVVFLTLSVLGFIKALTGEEWRIPVLDEFADKVPIN